LKKGLPRAALRRRNFLNNFEGGAARMGGLGDGASDDEVVGSGANGLGWSCYARLVVLKGARRPHAGDYDDEFWAAGAANRADLVRRGNHTVESSRFRKASE
jgi:hypothetical protein